MRSPIEIHDQLENFQTPDEDEIKREYEFKLPVIVSKQENKKIVGHFLENMNGPIKLVQDLIVMAQNMIAKYKAMKEETRAQVDAMVKAHDVEIKALQERYLPLILAYIRKMKEDFITQQNENFKLQKEIALYKRDITFYQHRIELERERMKQLEFKIFGMEVYELQTDVQYLEDIPQYNLRTESRKNMELKPVIH